MKIVPTLAMAALAICTTFAVPAAAQSTTRDPVANAKTTLAPGTQAKDFQLHAIAGELSGDVQLSQVNANGPVVVVVLRGFPGRQCPACSAQVGNIIKNADKFAAKNARVLLIYPGAKMQLGQHADDFLQGTKLPKPLTMLLDPDYAFTNLYGLRWNATNETAYPTTLVIDESGKIRYTKVSETHRGRATSEEILAAL
ncbi:redoxin family protein [Novipirellula caenicola]|uniref:Thioredoxin domain-containing protein n=1 Tax=Novipirellula caenicola TaxID=1536901 RepID=A0ABP9VWA2_9BACT